MRMVKTLAVALLVSGLWSATPASAQPLGSFRWQLQPYCNIITLAVVQQGGQYQLDGQDDQCGAAVKASAVGLAFQNPSPFGSIGFGLTIVTSPGGTPVHVDATISISTLSGIWRDSAGNSGTFIFTPGAGVAGPPRPVPPSGIAPASITNVQIANNTVGVANINTAEVQARVSGACPAGQAVRTINANGSVTCQSIGATTELLYSGQVSDNTITFTYELFRTIGSFTKQSATSSLVTHWTTHLRTATAATGFCHFQVRIDNVQSTGTTFPGPVLYQEGAGTNDAPISQTDYWAGLAAGSHTVSIWLRGSATSCTENFGNFNKTVVITEQ